jgi:fructuronate reductase
MTASRTAPAADQPAVQAWPRLSRAGGDAGPAAQVRIVHLGLGNFFRAHQAWYTEQAPDGAEWGIAAFTGRSVELAQALSGQDGVYTLITRGPDGDSCRVIGSVTDTHAGADQAALLDYLTRPEVAIVTLTVIRWSAISLRSAGTRPPPC